MTEQEYKVMKAHHEEAQRAAHEASGAKKGLEDRLRKEFKLPHLAAAKAKLKSYDALVARLDAEVEEAKTAYEEEFADEA